MRRRNPRIIAIAAACAVVLVAALAFVLTRGGDDNSGPGGGGGGSGPAAGGSNTLPSGPDILPDKSITLASDVVVIRGGNGKTVKSLGSDGHSFVLDGSVKNVDELQPGKVALLTGITAVKVDSVSKQGNDVLVSFEPATLPDVVQDGSLDWSGRAVDLTTAAVILSPDAPETSDTDQGGGSGGPSSTDSPAPTDTAVPMDTAVPTDTAAPTDTASPSDSTTPSAAATATATPQGLIAPPRLAVQRREVSGKLGDLGFTLAYTPALGGAEIDLKLTKVGDLHGTGELDVKLGSLKSSGSAKISGGHVEHFDTKFDDLSGTADISVNLQAGKNVDALTTPPFFKLPVSITVPFPIAGIPFSYSLETTIQVQLSLAIAGDSLSGKAHVSFGGDAGFSFDNGSITLSGKRSQDSPDTVTSLRGGNSGPVGVVLTAEVPKVGLGLYALQTGAGVYLSSGTSTAMQVLGGSAVPCMGLQQAYVLAAGATAKFLGKEFEIARKAIVDKRWERFVPNTAQCSGK